MEIRQFSQWKIGANMQILRLKRRLSFSDLKLSLAPYLAFLLAFVFVTYYFGKFTALTFTSKIDVDEEEAQLDFLEVAKILNDPKKTSTPSLLGDPNDPPLPLKTSLEQDGVKVTRDIYKDSWIRTSKACHHKKASLVLVVVISAPANLKQRQAIRESWGGVAARSKHSAIVYLVGRPKEGLVQLERESEESGDLVITDNVDSYQNLTLKTLATFSWAKQFCPQADFILKTDDDMFVQVKRLLFTARGLRKALAGQSMIVGNLATGWEPVRNPLSKYFITEAQFSGVHYPPFVTGPSYLISRQAADLIFKTSMDMPFFHLEDVFLTGIVAEEVNVPRRMATEFRNNANPIPSAFLGCTLLRTISIHKVKPEDQAELLEKSRNPSCGKGPPPIA